MLYNTSFGALTQLYAGTVLEGATLNGKVGLLFVSGIQWGTERLSSTLSLGHASVRLWRRHRTPSSGKSFGIGSRSKSRTREGDARLVEMGGGVLDGVVQGGMTVPNTTSLMAYKSEDTSSLVKISSSSPPLSVSLSYRLRDSGADVMSSPLGATTAKSRAV